MVKLVCGVGINDADYCIQLMETIGYVGGKQKRKLTWACPYYRVWKNVLVRCYSTRSLARNPTYTECYVSDEWLVFSTFRKWMEQQDWQNRQLDKDLLSPGNKLYGPETCVFVDRVVNMFLTDRGNARGNWPTGVCWHSAVKKFMASCSNPLTGKQEHLGCFTCPDTAHAAWKSRKHELACLLADQQTDPRVAEALRARYL